MTGSFAHRSYPCDECPFRADNTNHPRSKFPPERWNALGDTVRDPETAEHPGLGDPMFACHKGTPGDPDRDLACAGWLARHGADHVRVRLAVSMGHLDGSALEPGDHWPPLHDSWSDVVRHHSSEA